MKIHKSRANRFKEITEGYGDYLKALLWKMTGNREVFEEALQETLVRIWKHTDKIKEPTAKSYLFRIVQTSTSLAWKNLKAQANPLPADDLIPAADNQPEQRKTESVLEIIRKRICQLPCKQSLAITLRYLNQQEYAQIAESLNCSEASARSHVSKALSALRSHISNQPEKGI